MPMPARLGWYNTIWATTGAIAFFASGALFALRPDAVLWAAAACHGATWLWLVWPRRGPAREGLSAMEIPHSGTAIPRARKQAFLFTAWASNALAYFLNVGFSALAPQLGERLSLAPSVMIWLASTTLIARAFAFAFFSRWEGWHYHPVWGRLAFGAQPALIALMFFSGSVPAIMAAAALFGACLALSYSGSIYYSLDIGEEKASHGGLHEAILGLGILGGPLVGAAGSGGAGRLGGELAIVGVALALTAAAFLLIARVGRAR
jgi:hypothetical protein